MKQVTLHSSDFKAMISGVKYSLITDHSRPPLELIRFDIGPTVIKATTCNGFTLSVVTLEGDFLEKESDFFTAYLRPIPIPKVGRRSYADRPVVIGRQVYEGVEATYIRLKNDYGEVEYTFRDPVEVPNFDKVLEEAKQAENEAAFDARLFRNALNAISTATNDLSARNAYYKLRTPSNPLKPSYLLAKLSKDLTLEQVVLPVRMN